MDGIASFIYTNNLDTSTDSQDPEVTVNSFDIARVTSIGNVEIEELIGAGTGGRLWDVAAGALIAFLHHQLSSSTTATATMSINLANKQVLELGSGTGVVGLAYLKAYSKTFDLSDVTRRPLVTLTDFDFICPMIVCNARRNCMDDHLESGLLAVQSLSWSRASAVESVVVTGCHPDIILISDCVYLETAFEALLTTLECLMNAETVCWMSYTRRRHAERRFFQNLRKQFVVREELEYPQADALKRIRTSVYTIKKKSVN
eukprot:Partr_v1_DN28199_c1_g1_i1_m55339 putative Putative methyltransferase